MSTNHTTFTNNLSDLTTDNNSESIINILPYSTFDDVPEEIKRQLYNQGLPSNDKLSEHTIVCGYLKNQNNAPFIAFLEPPDASYSIDKATLKYWTADGNYCYGPFGGTKRLIFEQLEHFSDNIFSEKSQRTLNGVLNETVDNSTLQQECVGDFSIAQALCKNTYMFEHKQNLSNFFIFPTNFHSIGYSNFVNLIKQTTPVFPKAFSKVKDIATSNPSLNQPQAYLISIALSNNESRKRISYLYESKKAYKSGEKPLMIYKRIPSKDPSVYQDKDINYLLTNNGKYIALDPNDIVIKTNECCCFRVLSYDKVVEGFPTEVSEETKQLIANPFPPELAIINAEATKRYQESLQSKETQNPNMIQE